MNPYNKMRTQYKWSSSSSTSPHRNYKRKTCVLVVVTDPLCACSKFLILCLAYFCLFVSTSLVPLKPFQNDRYACVLFGFPLVGFGFSFRIDIICVILFDSGVRMNILFIVFLLDCHVHLRNIFNNIELQFVNFKKREYFHHTFTVALPILEFICVDSSK